ncbi:MAG: ribbon-helix-helix domain-containing protein [Burkholderiales bacterium]|nr:ribbon-helix-helix domain-containing protein [Burkholderiales bacterium]
MVTKGKQLAITVYVRPDQLEALRRLAEHTRVPMATYLREGIDDLLVKYRREIRTKPK